MKHSYMMPELQMLPLSGEQDVLTVSGLPTVASGNGEWIGWDDLIG